MQHNKQLERTYFFGKLRKNALSLVPVLSRLVFMMLASSSCFFSPKEDRAKLEETKSIWANFPLYPAMQEVDSSTQSGFGKAYISKHFRCNESYDNMRSFFVERLTQNGWKLVKERHLKDWGKDVGGSELEFQKRISRSTFNLQERRQTTAGIMESESAGITPRSIAPIARSKFTTS